MVPPSRIIHFSVLWALQDIPPTLRRNESPRNTNEENTTTKGLSSWHSSGLIRGMYPGRLREGRWRWPRAPGLGPGPRRGWPCVRQRWAPSRGACELHTVLESRSACAFWVCLSSDPHYSYFFPFVVGYRNLICGQWWWGRGSCPPLHDSPHSPLPPIQSPRPPLFAVGMFSPR